jgi:hypothetical protein
MVLIIIAHFVLTLQVGVFWVILIIELAKIEKLIYLIKITVVVVSQLGS